MTRRIEQDFWSRRKAAVQAEQEAEAARARAREEAISAAESAEKQAEKTDAELLEELGLPEPESLGPGDDFSAFLSKAVPEHLRKRALRRLWTTNPVLANLDGLVDYDDDFTGKGAAIEALKTAYEVGRGVVTRLADNSDAPVTSRPAPVEKVEATLIAEETAPPEPADVDIVESEPEQPAQRRPRHMVFTFSKEASA